MGRGSVLPFHECVTISMRPLRPILCRCARRRIQSLSSWLTPGTSHGDSKDRPSIGINPRRQLPRVFDGCPSWCTFRPAIAKDRSRSAFKVFHLPDGFLQRGSCGFVAPRCQSWDSSSCLRPQASRSKTEFPRCITLRSFSLASSVSLSQKSTSVTLAFQGKLVFEAFLHCRVRRATATLP
jgi:hypothetical protein